MDSTRRTVSTRRTTWQELAPQVRADVETILGSEVVLAESQAHGYSPGSADRVRTAAGDRAFVKAVSRTRSADAYDIHRRELDVLRRLPDAAPAPRLLGAHESDEWVALVIEDVDGRHPGLPPERRELIALLGALLEQPVVRDPSGAAPFPEATAELAPSFDGWTRLRSDGDVSALPAWAASHLDELEALAAGAARAAHGDRLVHLDLRFDNLLVDTSARVWVVDWPWAGTGARWIDGVTLLLDARVNGSTVDVDRIAATHPLFRGATREDVDAFLAGLAGYFFDAARHPAPLNMPTLRAFQRRQGVVAIEWLEQRRA
ncbi:phosphotransferase [Oerskovia sp. USHLN155]|uniref:phosphotransferase n=1 Tax=Oerskovia sp. USHLN155 TaxID=3081288 RepID=UPI00301A9564